MAELEFRELEEAYRVEGMLFEVYRPKARSPMGYIWSDETFTTDDENEACEYKADELDQIAAKLRSLNGEPNTRSTDERVRELKERLEFAYDADEAEHRKTRDSYLSGKMDGIDTALSSIDQFFPELFPACKPSEEEVKCIHGVPNSAGYCPRCDEENRSDPA